VVTKAICNKGLSGNSSILPRSNFGVGGQDSSPQSPTISYRHRYKPKKKDSDMKIDKTTYIDRRKVRQIGMTADHTSRPDVFYFLPIAHFLKQLPTHNGTFVFAPTHEANPSAKSKEPFFSNAFTNCYGNKQFKF